MKKSFYFPGIASFIVATIFCLQGCLKDTYQKTYTYTYYKPVYKTTDEVRANIKSSEPADIKQAGKIYIRGQYIFLNDVDKGIHIIDNSNPAQPKNIGFINIPGNMDLAVKGNTLYADLYTALVAIDITDPHHIVLKKVIESVFPHRYYNGYFTPDSTKVIASWEKRDTTVTEKGRLGMEKNAGLLIYTVADVNPRFFSPFASSSSSPYGAGGSMARFTLINNTLYTVGSSDLNVFNISNLSDPAYITNKNIGRV